jgi:hypothetical protein
MDCNETNKRTINRSLALIGLQEKNKIDKAKGSSSSSRAKQIDEELLTTVLPDDCADRATDSAA